MSIIVKQELKVKHPHESTKKTCQEVSAASTIIPNLQLAKLSQIVFVHRGVDEPPVTIEFIRVTSALPETI